MKTARARQRLALICFTMLILRSVSAEGKYFGIGEQSTSPNGKFVVRIIDVARDWKFEIKDRSSGRLSLLSADYNPIHALRWTDNSRSILIVEQASEGTFAGVMHFNGNRWTETDFLPTKLDDKFTLLFWKPKEKSVRLHYSVTHEAGRDKEGDRTYKTYRCSFDVNYASGRRSLFEKIPFSDKEAHTVKSDLN